MDERMQPHLVWPDLLTMDLDAACLDWQAFRDGVDLLPVHGDPAGGCSCALLRYHPGAQIPRHLHVGMEFLLILRGSQRDERGEYAAGTFLINPANSSHAVVSEQGCVVLAIWEKPVRFISPQP